MNLQKSLNSQLNFWNLQKKVGNEIELRVHPVMIPEDKMIAKVDGVMNGISVIGDKVGETMFYGAGAGGDATASAGCKIIDIARRGKGSPMLGFENQPGEKVTLMAKRKYSNKILFKTWVADKSGTLAKMLQF